MWRGQWHPWMSPNFGPIGCVGAILFYLLMVAGIAGLLYMPWSLLKESRLECHEGHAVQGPRQPHAWRSKGMGVLAGRQVAIARVGFRALPLRRRGAPADFTSSSRRTNRFRSTDSSSFCSTTGLNVRLAIRALITGGRSTIDGSAISGSPRAPTYGSGVTVRAASCKAWRNWTRRPGGLGLPQRAPTLMMPMV